MKWFWTGLSFRITEIQESDCKFFYCLFYSVKVLYLSIHSLRSAKIAGSIFFSKEQAAHLPRQAAQ